MNAYLYPLILIILSIGLTVIWHIADNWYMETKGWKRPKKPLTTTQIKDLKQARNVLRSPKNKLSIGFCTMGLHESTIDLLWTYRTTIRNQFWSESTIHPITRHQVFWFKSNKERLQLIKFLLKHSRYDR